jgi:hypothetical protein
VGVVFAFDIATLRIREIKGNTVEKYSYSRVENKVIHAASGHDTLICLTILKRMLNGTSIAKFT